jgi:hypothetical protein
MGLLNYDGSIYVPPVNNTAHNAPTQWSMTSTAYRFTSACPGNSICGTPLPIGFKNLYGQHIDGINKLWWETSVELNVREYIVERSLDGVNFTRINSTEAVGRANTYSIADNDFKRGYINYYKVTAVENDGAQSSTNVYPIINTDDKILITSVFPNPASEKLSVAITGKGAMEQCVFTVYDQFGKKVLEKQEKINFGRNLTDLNIENLNKGIYMVEIRTTDNSVVSKQKFTKM